MENNKAGEHTQGEWRIQIAANDTYVMAEKESMSICRVMQRRCHEQTKANALLIASAPKMLEALEKLTSNSKAMALISDEDFNLAISAIKSAKGK